MSKLSFLLRAGLVGAVAGMAAGGAANAQLERAVQVAQQSTEAGQQSQDRVEQLDDSRSDMARQYRAVLQQMESQKLFVDQQRVFLNSQQNEIQSLQAQINRVDSVKVELLPMMREMVDNLANFVDLDLPFNMIERKERVQRLYDTLDDADVSVAERYRVILNAYDIEASYGRGINAYEGPLAEGGDDVVDFLRVGRLMLIYSRKDNDEYGYWDRESDSWQPLPGDYGLQLSKAFRIARNAAAPEILLAPLPGPSQAEYKAAANLPPAPSSAPPPAPEQPAADAEGADADAENAAPAEESENTEGGDAAENQ